LAGVFGKKGNMSAHDKENPKLVTRYLTRKDGELRKWGDTPPQSREDTMFMAKGLFEIDSRTGEFEATPWVIEFNPLIPVELRKEILEKSGVDESHALEAKNVDPTPFSHAFIRQLLGEDVGSESQNTEGEES